jgi:TonB family protein
MRIHHRGILAAISGLLAATGASAQPQCDCTSIVGSCTATAQLQDSLIEITSSVQQCSRVDYLVDGIPFVSLVVDGAAQRSAIVQGTPAVIVQGCQVCREDLATAAATSTGSGSGLVSEGEPMRLISVDPVYPAEAAAAGLEGWVDVSFAVSAFGTVTAPAVVAAEPAGVFDAAALAAVSRWRYTRPPPGEERQVTERVRFELSDALFALSADRPAARQAASAPQRNNCVREESRFDFGALVDISLINACDVPLLVYSCTAGTGADRNRWTCRDPEQATTVLRPAALTAAPATVAGLTGVGRLEISRAPNTEHWWLACAVDNSDCRAEGRQWIRSLNRQIASVDPQDRTRARLARSY